MIIQYDNLLDVKDQLELYEYLRNEPVWKFGAYSKGNLSLPNLNYFWKASLDGNEYL